MTIGIVWIEHSALTEALDHVDAGFQRLNLLLLLLVGFLPFPTSVMEEYLSPSHPEHSGDRVAVAFFGIVLFLLMPDADRARALRRARGPVRRRRRRGARRGEPACATSSAPSLVFYAVATGLGLISPYVGVVLYVAIGVYLLLPVRWLLHRRFAHRA